MKILVTGGCGFIGSHLTDALIKQEHEVVVFDRDPPPAWKNPRAQYIRGDVCDNLDNLVKRKFDVIYHFAAEVGSGLSMADPKKFFRSNSLGTANLMQAMRSSGRHAKVIVASSATVYGEATYKCPKHGIFYPALRPVEQLQKDRWEVACPMCGLDAEAVAIKEDRILKPASIYGQTKLDQELTCMLLARTWDFPAIAFRLFGVFGPRQSLCNPYTGVLALFATRVFANLPIMHYEDGKQNKSYIYIDDVIKALLLALENKKAEGRVFNLGTEKPVTIRYIAEKLVEKINPSIKIIATGKFRASDTRHSWPDTSLARDTLGWQTEFTFDEGLDVLVKWLATIPSEKIKASIAFFEEAERYARSCGLEV